jgi:hypothetical protein
MKCKKEQLILISVIVLLAGYLLAQKGGRTHYALPQLPKIEKKEITKLSLKKDSLQIDLERKGDGWTIEPQGYPADRNVVDNMLGSVAGLSLSALVSEDEGLAAYGLDLAERIEVKASTRDKLGRSFFVGKAVPSGRHTFVKLDKEKGIFHADGDLQEVFDTNVPRLRDKTVMRINGEVHDIVLSKGKKKLTLVAVVPSGKEGEEKKKGQGSAEHRWKTAAGKPANDREVDGIISSLRDLPCDGFLEGKEKSDFSHPAYAVALTGEKTYTLALFKDKEKNDSFDAVSSESAYPFRLAGWRAREIMKDFSVLTGTN